MKSIFPVVSLALVFGLAVPHAWNNGQAGNTTTSVSSECTDPPYATHDWIADHAIEMLPDDEKAWLLPHRAVYLIGTEAPDHKLIPLSCGVPHRGYDDRQRGHSIEWNSDVTEMLNDRPAAPAQEEFGKAILAFQQGEPGHAAFYLGAMAHYLGDVSQYGHTYRDEVNHGNYESWAAARTTALDDETFDDYIDRDSLVRRTPYTAVRRVAHAAFAGKGDILPAAKMDSLWSTKPDEFINSTGESLNLAVNELADVLHTFYLNVVDEE